jgi:ABC-2 type transport system permease protein
VSDFAATGALVRLALRRDRVLMPVWVAVFAVMATFSAAATADLYPTVESRVQVAETANRSPSLVALYGRIYAPDSLGAVAMWKMAGTGAIMVAVLGLIMAVRHTRAEEENGRLELVGAAAVGRFAALTAALIVALITNGALGLFTAAGLTAAGLPAAGSLAFGLSWASVGIVFATIGLVAAQVTRSARLATGIGSAMLGLVYLLRAIGDSSPGNALVALSWLSPIGWGQRVQAYAGERWWVLLLMLGAAAALTGVAYLLVARRDLGSGLLPDRAGRAAAAPSLRSPLALAWRLQKGTLLGWSFGLLVLGAVFGSMASNVEGFFDDPDMKEMIARLGGTQVISDAFLAAELSIMGVVASAYGIQAAMRLRAEESAPHAESLLATAITRLRWAASHVVVALAGTTVVLVVAGLAAGGAHAAQTGDAAQVGRVLGAALAQAPAAWVLVGIVVLAFGLAPRFTAAGWAFLVGFFLLGELGPLLELDQWILDLSPYSHVPRLPGAELTIAPLLGLVIVAAALVAAGLAAFRRRDVG